MKLTCETEVLFCKFGTPRCRDGDDRDGVVPVLTRFEFCARVVEVAFKDDDSGREDACGGPGSEIGLGIVRWFEGCVEG